MTQETSSPGRSSTHPMQHGHRPASSSQVAATLVPEAGWHFLHMFYRVDRGALSRLSAEDRAAGRDELKQILDKSAPGAPDQLQCFAVPGHKADFGVMMAGSDLKAVHAIQVKIQASRLGPALVPADSFYSITEISEYVPDVDEYGRILRDREGVDPESSVYKTKVASYCRAAPADEPPAALPRVPRLALPLLLSDEQDAPGRPELVPPSLRTALGAHEPARPQRHEIRGKVSQLITASTGLDDWEWGVTLWGRNPSYLKEIVYTMRFDESSAKYALFGAFYFGYILSPSDLAETIRL